LRKSPVFYNTDMELVSSLYRDMRMQYLAAPLELVSALAVVLRPILT
jgi:hypothetical protein